MPRRPTALTLTLLLATLWTGNATADTSRGKQLFEGKCAMCHVTAAGQPNGVGPNLGGVVGRQVGKYPGFGYSAALASSNETWTMTLLDRFLRRPAEAMPGTAMPFGGLGQESDRKALIEYLQTMR